MATFNKNISAQTVSGYLNKVKSLYPSTRKLIKSCAEGGHFDQKSLKSCIGFTGKSIDTMYVMVGVVIAAIKHSGPGRDVKETLSSGKPTLNKFFNLLYAGDGRKLHAYLNSASGEWFEKLFKMVAGDDALYTKLKNSVNSIRMSSKRKRNLFKSSLESLKDLILAACPGVHVTGDELYTGESDEDKRLEKDELAIRRELFKQRTPDGKKIAAAYRHSIVVNVYRENHPAWHSDEFKCFFSDGDQEIVYYSQETKTILEEQTKKLYEQIQYVKTDEDKQALYAEFARQNARQNSRHPIRLAVRKWGVLDDECISKIAKKLFEWLIQFPHILTVSKKAVKSIPQREQEVNWHSGTIHKESSADQRRTNIGNSRRRTPDISLRGQEVLKFLGPAPDLLLQEFASREEAMKEGYKEAELPYNASADGMVFYKPSDDGKKHIAIVWLYFDVNPQAVASSVREVLKNPRTVS